MKRPNCDCHGEPMWFHTDRRRKRGRYWRCAVRERSRRRRRYWDDPIKAARVVEEARRKERIARMEAELKELMNAS